MRDDGRTLTAEEWTAIWGEDESDDEGASYALPKMYPGGKIRCPNCGYWQGNEAVVDTYRWCMRCCTVLQESDTLYWDTPLGLGPLRLVAASYGHPRDPKLAVDVRPQLQARVGVSDRLDIRREESLVDWLGNPCPGVLKTLRIRYVSLEGVAKGRRREVWLQESEGSRLSASLNADPTAPTPKRRPLASRRLTPQEGHLGEAASLRVPTTIPLVVVFSAVYGSPGGSSRGRGKIDVTEFMQGRVDLADGKYLFMSQKEPLADLFGDPCPGRDKCLVLRYEMVGTEGRVEAVESDGRLLTPISISCTPMLAPLILVESATYGQTRQGIDERLQVVQRELSDVFSLQNRKDIGMPLSREENKRLMRLRPLIADLEYLKTVTPKYVDIRASLQEIIETLGGGVLELVAASVDANHLFGNPLPGKKKELRVRYLVVGHDSERLTSLEETTSSGYPRNFILQRQGQVVVQAKDDRMGRGILENDVLVDSPKVLPVVEILNSSYGHPRNATKTYDISSKLRQMIERQGGEKLVIDCKTDLLKLFDEPCRGVRKTIKISYVARGLNGIVRVSERDSYLVADIIVGYYNRQNFRDSKLLADRHTHGSKNRTRNPAFNAHHNQPLSDGDSASNSEPEEYNLDFVAAGADGLCVPLQNQNHDQELPPPLPLVLGGGGGIASTEPAVAEDDGGLRTTLTVAEQRRQRRRERREIHQRELRRREAERESERRRMRTDRARRDREVARAVREAEDAERVRLLREAQEAENAAPVAARLMRTLQRKAAAAIAAAASGATTPTASGTTPASPRTMLAASGTTAAAPAVEGRGAVVVPVEDEGVREAAASAPPAAGLLSSDDEQRQSRDRQPPGVRFGHVATLREGHGRDLERRRSDPAAIAPDPEPTLPRKVRRKPKRPDDVEGERDRGRATAAGKVHAGEAKRGALGESSPPLSSTRARAAAADDIGTQNDGSNLDPSSTLQHDSAPETVVDAAQAAVSPESQFAGMGLGHDRPRRKPSEERIGEPRAVFTHRASSVSATARDAAAAGEVARISTGERGAVTVGEGGSGNRERRPSSRGRVGSVLPDKK